MTEQPGEYENKAELAERYMVSMDAAPPVPVETPMSSTTMEPVCGDDGSVQATPPTDYDG